MSPGSEDIDLASVYSELFNSVDDKTKVKLNTNDDLFFTDVLYTMLFHCEACLTMGLWPVL